MPKPAINMEIHARDKTRRAFDSARQRISNLERSAGNLTTLFRGGLGLTAVAGTVTALIAPVRKAIVELDDLGKSARNLGIAVDELELARRFGELNGVELKQVDDAMQRFTRRLGQARQGTGELLKVLQQMGIRLKTEHGTWRTSADVFAEFTERLREMKSQADVLAAGVGAFDTTGARWATALARSEQSYASFVRANQDMVRDLPKAVEEAEAAADAFAILGNTLKDITRPAMTGATEALGEFARQADVLLRNPSFRTLVALFATKFTPTLPDYTPPNPYANRGIGRGIAGLPAAAEARQRVDAAKAEREERERLLEIDAELVAQSDVFLASLDERYTKLRFATDQEAAFVRAYGTSAEKIVQNYLDREKTQQELVRLVQEKLELGELELSQAHAILGIRQQELETLKMQRELAQSLAHDIGGLLSGFQDNTAGWLSAIGGAFSIYGTYAGTGAGKGLLNLFKPRPIMPFNAAAPRGGDTFVNQITVQGSDFDRVFNDKLAQSGDILLGVMNDAQRRRSRRGGV